MAVDGQQRQDLAHLIHGKQFVRYERLRIVRL